MGKAAVALALVLGGWTTAAGAQTAMDAAAAPAGGPRITLADAVRIALRQNTTVRQAENADALSAAAVRQQRLQFLPSLRLSTSGAQNIGRTFSESEGTIVSQNTQSLTAGVSSSLTLFDGLANVASLRQASLAGDASGQDLTRARQTAAFTVASNYLALVTDQAQLEVQQENLAAQQALEAQIDKLVQAGSRAIPDLYQQQATVAAAKSAVVSASRDLEAARIEIIRTLQLDPGGRYDFVAPTVAGPDTAAAFDLDSLLARAYANRADLAAETSRVSAAGQGVKAASGGRWPTVTLSAGYNSSYTTATALSLADQLDQRRGGSVALGISIPLFDQGQTGLATERARIDQENARLAVESQRQTVGVEIRRAFLDYEAARQQLAAAEAQLKASDLAATTAQKRYEAGAGTLVEVAQARATRVQAASSAVTARFGLVFQAALMSYHTGELDPEQFVV